MPGAAYAGGNSKSRVAYQKKQMDGSLAGEPEAKAPLLVLKGGGWYDIVVDGEVVDKAQGFKDAQEAAKAAVGG